MSETCVEMSDSPLALCGRVKAYIGCGCTTGRVLVNDVTWHGPDRLWLQVTAPPRAINTSSLLQWRDSILFTFLAIDSLIYLYLLPALRLNMIMFT